VTESDEATGPLSRRRRSVLLVVAAVVVLLVGGLGYYWLKPGSPPHVSVRITDPIFELKTDDLRGLTLDSALRKIDYPDVVYKYHVGQVWINDVTGPDRVVIPIPRNTQEWTVAAVCFQALTTEVNAANDGVAPGQLPSGHFVTFGIIPTSGITPELHDQINQRSLDESLTGCSIGLREMHVYHPDGGRVIKVN
jgi:hypothetical protein